MGLSEFVEFFQRKWPEVAISDDVISSIIRTLPAYVQFVDGSSRSWKRRVPERFFLHPLNVGTLVQVDLLFVKTGFFQSGLVFVMVDSFSQRTKLEWLRSASGAAVARAFEKILQRIQFV